MRSIDRNRIEHQQWRIMETISHRLRQLALSFVLLPLAPVLLAQTPIQLELQTLNASDSSAVEFGSSLSLAGDRALIGDPYGNDGLGRAYVFERASASGWLEVAQLEASDASVDEPGNGLFGTSVSLEGDRALVGSPNIIGAAYLYERDGSGEWIEVAKLTASDGAFRESFGWSVALAGDRALVGAPDGGGRNSGSVYVFERDVVGTWIEVAKFTASDAAFGDRFGHSLSVSGNRVLVGAPYDDIGDPAVAAPGSAYVFESNASGQWVEVAKLIASDAPDNALFGDSGVIVR